MAKALFESDDLRAAMEVLHIAASKVQKPEDGFAKMQVVFDAKHREHVAGFVVGRNLVTQFAAPCTADEEFSSLVPVDMVFNLLKSPPDKKITLSVPEAGKIAIASGSHKAKFVTPGIDTHSFLPRFQPDVSFATPTTFNDLLVRVQAAIFTEAASTSNAAQRVLDGAMFRSTQGRLRVVATDNNRISRVEMACPVDFDFVVDRQAVASMQQIFKVDADALHIKIDPNAVTLRCGHAVIKMPRLGGGQPPALIDTIFDTPWTEWATIDNSVGMLQALKRVKQVASDRVTQVDIEPTLIRLTSVAATGPRIGDSSETIAAKASSSFSFKIYSDYLVDALRESKAIRLGWLNATTPAVVEHTNCSFHTRHVLGLMRW